MPKWQDSRYLVYVSPLTVSLFIQTLQILDHGLKVCIMFGYNPQIIFCSFFLFEPSHFQALLHSKKQHSGNLMSATPPTVLCWLYWNFTDVLLMVWKCAHVLNIILRLCFATFFLQVDFICILGIYMYNYPSDRIWYWVLYVSYSSYQFLPTVLKHVLIPLSQFKTNLTNFCHFFQVWT